MNILAAVTLLAQLAHAQPELRGEPLMRALQSGGYTILVRHARTDRNIPTKEVPGQPTPPLRADQRNLTAEGERDVRLMQSVIQKYHLPIGEVVSSPVYRCRETADAFGTPALTPVLRTFPLTAETQALVAVAPKPGTNRVLVTHHFVIEGTVPGIVAGDVGESEAAVVKPAGDGKVTLVGKIKLADWEALASGAKVADAKPEVKIDPAVVMKLAHNYLDAFNSGDAAKMRAFIESSMLAAPDRPIETRLQTYTKLFDEYGVLQYKNVQTTTNDAVAFQVDSKRGAMIVTVTASQEQVGRAKSVTFALPGAGGHP